jgi:hypothetical protein
MKHCGQPADRPLGGGGGGGRKVASQPAISPSSVAQGPSQPTPRGHGTDRFVRLLQVNGLGSRWGPGCSGGAGAGARYGCKVRVAIPARAPL